MMITINNFIFNVGDVVLAKKQIDKRKNLQKKSDLCIQIPFKMGNMMFNRRLGTASDPDSELSEELFLIFTIFNFNVICSS